MTKSVFKICSSAKYFLFPTLTQPYHCFKFIDQTKQIPKQSNILNIVLRREENGEIRLREDKPHMIDIELRNQILECSKEFSCRAMNGSRHMGHYCLLQQETIVDSWKISLVNIYKWDKSSSFGERSIAFKDDEALHDT